MSALAGASYFLLERRSPSRLTQKDFPRPTASRVCTHPRCGFTGLHTPALRLRRRWPGAARVSSGRGHPRVPRLLELHPRAQDPAPRAATCHPLIARFSLPDTPYTLALDLDRAPKGSHRTSRTQSRGGCHGRGPAGFSHFQATASSQLNALASSWRQILRASIVETELPAPSIRWRRCGRS